MARTSTKTTRGRKPKASKSTSASTRRPTPARSSAAPWKVGKSEVGVRIRMYRVGFGDFFLLTFLDDDEQPQHVIVDCGVFKGTKQTGDIGSIEAAVADMAQTTGGNVALIVMTHRHADHIAGFARCDETFRGLTVGGVWMPVWENEYEPVVSNFQAQLTRTALGLRQHLAAFGASESKEQATARAYMENATGELGAAAKGSNAKALDLLKNGFKAVTPAYYQAGDKAKLPKALADAGLAAQILGPPPVTDLDLMKLMDLQKTVGQYLTGDGSEDDDADAPPFESVWEATKKDDLDPNVFREWLATRYGFKEVDEAAGYDARLRMEKTLKESGSVAALTAAKKLNAFLNNQSLVILFTFRGRQLLFVGDAQAGNWEHWLFDTDTPDKKASGTMSPDARQVLTSLNFYKVGHHGSGNATPRVAAETMVGHRFASMCSTQADVYGTENPDDPTRGTEVPRGPLLDELETKSALVRSDQIDILVAGKTIKAKVPAKLPASLPDSRFEVGPLWVDCYL
jgi:hypothetical protein